MLKALQPATVLAVDDEELVLDLIHVALEDGGFLVRTASTGAEAMAILEKDRARDIQGLVTDVYLKGDHSGWDIAPRLGH